MRVFIVTSNRAKYLEIADILDKHGIEAVHKRMELLEYGDTIQRRVRSKAQAAYNIMTGPVVADDTGVFFHAYDNFPGHLPKRVFREIGFDGLMKKLDGKDRTASFRTMLCYYTDFGPQFFQGEMKGRIDVRVHPERVPGLPYERIFIPDGIDRAVSEMTFEEKQKISHRADAARKLADFITRRLHNK